MVLFECRLNLATAWQNKLDWHRSVLNNLSRRMSPPFEHPLTIHWVVAFELVAVVAVVAVSVSVDDLENSVGVGPAGAAAVAFRYTRWAGLAPCSSSSS